MLVDKQSEVMSDLLFTVHQQGGDDVTWKPPILSNDDINPGKHAHSVSDPFTNWAANIEG